MEEPLVSIIMPVYNARLYVATAIKSVLQQTYKNLELILIDDGATDGSEDICDTYAKQDCRVKVFHEKNKGICAARNLGLSIAKGKYIAFCDHDDEYEQDYLLVAVAGIEKTKADVIKFGYRTIKIIKENIIEKKDRNLKDGTYTWSTLMGDYAQYITCIKAIWNGVYSSEFIKKLSLQFDEFYKTGMEDYEFNIQYMRHSDKIACISKRLFNHYLRKGQSTDSKFSYNKFKCIQRVAKEEYDEVRKLKQDRVQIEKILSQQRAHYMQLIFMNIAKGEKKISRLQKCNILLQCSKTNPFYQSKNMSLRQIAESIRNNGKMGIALLLFDWEMYDILLFFLNIEYKIRNSEYCKVCRK